MKAKSKTFDKKTSSKPSYDSSTPSKSGPAGSGLLEGARKGLRIAKMKQDEASNQ